MKIFLPININGCIFRIKSQITKNAFTCKILIQLFQEWNPKLQLFSTLNPLHRLHTQRVSSGVIKPSKSFVWVKSPGTRILVAGFPTGDHTNRNPREEEEEEGWAGAGFAAPVLPFTPMDEGVVDFLALAALAAVMGYMSTLPSPTLRVMN